MRTDVTRQEAKELLDELYPDRVFAVEDGVVWVSGMNVSCKRVAEDIATTLRKHLDTPTSLVYDDGAVRFGGVEFRYGANA